MYSKLCRQILFCAFYFTFPWVCLCKQLRRLCMTWLISDKYYYVLTDAGELPISFDMDAIPDSFLADDNEIPPPLPPKIDEDNLT